MNKRSGVLVAASVLALALIASPAFAQRGGRGGGWGGGRGGWGGGYGGGYGYGGWGNSYYHGGYGGWGGYPSYGRGYYGNGYYGGYSALGAVLGGLGYNNYYNNGYYNNGYNNNGYYYSGVPSYGSSIYYGSPAGEVSLNSQGAILSNYQAQDSSTGAVINNSPSYAMQSFYSAPATSAGSSDLTVKVPANAQLWLGNMQSDQTGTERHFSFPALPQGSNMFTLRATWTENGQQVSRDRQVDMQAGKNQTIDFSQAGSDRPRSNTDVTTPAPSDTKKDLPLAPQTGDRKDKPLSPEDGTPKK